MFAAICEVPMSKTNGGIVAAGAAHAIGFVPSRGSAPNVGTTIARPLVDIDTPIMSCGSASIAW